MDQREEVKYELDGGGGRDGRVCRVVVVHMRMTHWHRISAIGGGKEGDSSWLLRQAGGG